MLDATNRCYDNTTKKNNRKICSTTKTKPAFHIFQIPYIFYEPQTHTQFKHIIQTRRLRRLSTGIVACEPWPFLVSTSFHIRVVYRMLISFHLQYMSELSKHASSFSLIFLPQKRWLFLETTYCYLGELYKENHRSFKRPKFFAPLHCWKIYS